MLKREVQLGGFSRGRGERRNLRKGADHKIQTIFFVWEILRIPPFPPEIPKEMNISMNPMHTSSLSTLPSTYRFLIFTNSLVAGNRYENLAKV